jgi:uncharacterized protein (TIGR02001 family)
MKIEISTMMRAITGLAAVCAVMGLTQGSAQAGDPLSLDISADVATKYVWRGQLITDDPVLQPSATLSGYGFSANVWGNVDFTDVNETDGGSFNLREVDYTLSYGFSPSEGLDLEAGIIWYTFPGGDSTGEVYGSVCLSAVPLSPTLAVYYDFDEVDGFYANLGVGHTFELTEKLGLSLGASLGWGDSDYHEFYFGQAASSSLSDLLLSASLDYTLTERVSVSLYVAYSDLLDSDVEALADTGYGDSDIVYGGVSLGVSF